MMVFGYRLMGKTDIVPGRFHVATKFYHVDYVPLIPVSSHLVFSQGGGKFHGIKIPLCGKSILVAWLKAVGLVAAIAGGMISFFTIQDLQYASRASTANVVGALTTCVAGIAMFVLATWFKPFTHASPARARKLCTAAGLTPEQIEQLLPDVSDGFPVVQDASKGARPMPVLPVEVI